MRAARRSPRLPAAAAVAAGATVADLSAGLGRAAPRGVCAQIAAAAAVDGSDVARTVAVVHRAASPPTVLAAVGRTLNETLAASGVASWAPISTDACDATPDTHVASDLLWGAQAGLALREDCPQWLRTILAANRDEYWIRLLAAKSPACAPRTVAALTRDPHYQVRAAASANPACPLWLLPAPIVAGDVYTNAAVAGRADCPPAVLRTLTAVHAHHPKIEAALTARVETPAEVLETRATAAESSPETRAAAAAHPNCPPRLRHRLASDPHEEVRAAVASRSDCPQRTLERLASDPEAAVRIAAAKNPRCPQTDLAPLSSDTDWRVRLAVAAHPNCPPAELSVLAADKDAPIRSEIAARPGCGPELVERFASDVDEEVRAAVAGRSDCPPRLLVILAGDGYWRVAAAAAATLRGLCGVATT